MLACCTDLGQSTRVKLCTDNNHKGYVAPYLSDIFSAYASYPGINTCALYWVIGGMEVAFLPVKILGFEVKRQAW